MVFIAAALLGYNRIPPIPANCSDIATGRRYDPWTAIQCDPEAARTVTIPIRVFRSTSKHPSPPARGRFQNAVLHESHDFKGDLKVLVTSEAGSGRKNPYESVSSLVNLQLRPC